MKPLILAAAAGIPPEIGEKFVARFVQTLRITSWLPLERSKRYTDAYSQNLYERLAEKLRARDTSDGRSILTHANLIVLYVDKKDGSESEIFEVFGTEALVIPLRFFDLGSMPLATKNEQGEAVNRLIKEGRRAIGRARKLLAIIAEEVSNRDNRTCLLLPPRNFGNEVSAVFDCVHNAALHGLEGKEFKKRLDSVYRLLPRRRQGKREYFVGRRGLVFRSPGKAGARHGMAPTWNSPSEHDASCVIRGRLRFGASYDPKFHYDCDIPHDGNRSFPSCHGTESIPRRRRHVNVAPNDNIR